QYKRNATYQRVKSSRVEDEWRKGEPVEKQGRKEPVGCRKEPQDPAHQSDHADDAPADNRRDRSADAVVGSTPIMQEDVDDHGCRKGEMAYDMMPSGCLEASSHNPLLGKRVGKRKGGHDDDQGGEQIRAGEHQESARAVDPNLVEQEDRCGQVSDEYDRLNGGEESSPLGRAVRFAKGCAAQQ